jgi:hypothetical protein
VRDFTQTEIAPRVLEIDTEERIPAGIIQGMDRLGLRAPGVGFKIMNEVADWPDAMAYAKECPVEMGIRGIRSYSIGAEGTPNVIRLIIARELLGAEFLPYRHWETALRIAHYTTRCALGRRFWRFT